MARYVQSQWNGAVVASFISHQSLDGPAPGPGGTYIDRQEREAQQAAFFADCYSNLTAQGIKLEMYDSVTSAADANDLRIALGYDQVNYYGSSYGTLLGLLVMRDHPQGARSVVLDSVFPPEASYLNEYGINAYQTFQRLFERAE